MNKTPIQVLLVEDSPSDANLFSHIFSRTNKSEWELVWVERLGDAINACNDLLFDVALLDLRLPDSDGLETIEEFRAAAPDIPIVVLTGSDDEDLALQAMAKGAQDYLVKDQITIQLLIRAIRYAIGRGQILKQLQDSERRFRGIFEQTFQTMMLLTPEGVVLEVNQNALNLTGAKQEDFLGLALWESEGWDYSESIQAWFKDAIETAAQGNFVRKEIEMRDRENATIWIDFSFKPLTDERGKVVMVIAEGRDICDRKKAEAEILKALEIERELNELKSNFISMVSHEFRNPMAAIRTSAEILQSYNQQLTEEKRSKYFEQIKIAIESMLKLLDEVLLLGRSETGRLKYEPETLDLEEFCRNLIENILLGSKSQHKFNFTCQGECSKVAMDRSLLEYIFNNLLSNAIKYSPPGSEINFDLNCQDEITTIQVQDRGIGIPLKDRERLFETFYRASNVSRIQGTGLGLAIVKKCVDLHQGQIHLESEVGVGTKVTVRLPSKLESGE